MKHSTAAPHARGLRLRHLFLEVLVVAFIGAGIAAAEEAAANAAAPSAPTFKPEEIEQLVAPIALYPDSLVAQILMASTYPLEVVSAARWVKENPKVTGKALEDAMQAQSWDPSVKSLTAFPPVIEMMDQKIDWTQKLGDAFLAQQKDVMDAVQRLRAKAQAEGNLESTKEQKVIVEQAPVNVEQKVVVEQAAPAAQPAAQTTIIKIEPTDPQVVYVPTYNPTTVYGGWPYPAYPPYSYYPPGYVAATSMMSFGVGMAVGAAMWGDCDWGGNDVDIDIDRYNEFNRTDISNKKWEHNGEHRKGVEYRDKGSRERYGNNQARNTQSREQFRGRAEQGRQDLGRQNQGGRAQNKGTRPQQQSGARNKQARPSGREGSANRPSSAARQGSDRAAAGNRASNAGRERPSTGQSRQSAFDGAGNGADARRASNRGSTSRQSAAASGRGMNSGSRGGYGGGGGGRGGGGFSGGRGGGGGGRGGRR